jgi:hypothetical protein
MSGDATSCHEQGSGSQVMVIGVEEMSLFDSRTLSHGSITTAAVVEKSFKFKQLRHSVKTITSGIQEILAP